MHRLAGFVALLTLSAAAAPTSLTVPPLQDSETNAEALVVCSDVAATSTLSALDFARSNLTALWYARNAAKHAEEILETSKQSDSDLSLLTGLMRITKLTTNDFVCAKRAILPYTTDRAGNDIATTARMLEGVYRAHISIDDRALEMLRHLDTVKPADLADQISTLQIERAQRYADLVQPTALALLLLIDTKRVENDRLPYLTVTSEQKKALISWIGEKFPEFGDGTPKDRWPDPSKTANLYLTMLNGRKCADEK